MISKESQFAYETNYICKGHVIETKTGLWRVELFDRVEKENFRTQEEALNFVKRKIFIFQKGKELGIAIDFIKNNVKPTKLLFPNSRTEEIFEVSEYRWNQIQINADPERKALGIAEVEPSEVTFNDIARAASYTPIRKVKTMFAFISISIAVISSFIIIMMIFSFTPNNDILLISMATGMPYQIASVTICGILATAFAIWAGVIFFIPFFRFKSKAKDENGGYSYQGKSWKSNYNERISANIISFILSTTSVILAAITTAFSSKTAFFNSSIQSSETITMIVFLILFNFAVILIFGIICGQLASTNNKRIIFLTTHVPEDDIDLFKSWTTHKRIESKSYAYDFETHYTFPGNQESLRVIKEEIFPKKLKVSQKKRVERFNDLNGRYSAGLIKYKENKRMISKKAGV